MPTDICLSLINKLADGHFHSGQKLAESLGITRAAVWKNIRQLEDMGLDIFAVRGKGYRLRQPLELLDGQLIRQYLREAGIRQIELDIFAQVDSTNRVLLDSSGLGASASGRVCLAESQTAGRGRRGRRWVSPFAGNIMLSVSWHYPQGPAALSGLSLALGIAVAQVLSSSLEVSGLGLKWPNDIYYRGRKLGGILVEVTGEAHGPCSVVAGLGVNQNLTERMSGEIDQPWTALSQIETHKMVSRNHLVAQLIRKFYSVFKTFENTGFSSYVNEWRRWDIYHNKAVTLSGAGGSLQGIARGINADGCLLLDTGQQIKTIGSGEISLRAAS